jgi:hypothetical protein
MLSLVIKLLGKASEMDGNERRLMHSESSPDGAKPRRITVKVYGINVKVD